MNFSSFSHGSLLGFQTEKKPRMAKKIKAFSVGEEPLASTVNGKRRPFVICNSDWPL